jgi:excisionase family DNA binding protein
MKMSVDDRLLSKGEARSYLGNISPRGIDRLLATRRLAGVKIGRRVLIAASELQRFISGLPNR